MLKDLEDRQFECPGPLCGAGDPLEPFCRDGDLDEAELLRFILERLRCVERLLPGGELAARSGLEPESMRLALSGETELGLGRAAGIARSLGLSAEWLLFGAGPPLLKDLPGAVIECRSTDELLEAIARRIRDLGG